MKRQKKTRLIWLPLLALLAWPFHALPQKLTAQVSKNKVYTGEAFQISFSCNGNLGEFKPPALRDFEVYSGPNQSTSVQIVNGNMSQTISYSYMIAARKEGKYTIGSASATVNGNKVESNPVTIEVIKGTPPQQNQSHNDPFADFFGNDPYAQQQQQQQAKPGVDEGDLFVRAYVNKKQAYLGEQIVVTHKVYSRLNLRNIQNLKMPGFTGFWSKDEKKTQFTSEVENMDGVNYVVVELAKTYLFPQRTGKLTIDPIELECIVRKQVKKNPSIFDQFFGSAYQDMVVKVKSKPVSIDVNALPEKGKPAGFTGAVGKYSFSAHLNRDRVKANEALNLKLTISGTGNISLAEGPKITFPDGFETYEPKLSENIATTGSVSGSKTYDYLLVPRREGEYVLKDIGFSYFDLDRKQYVTIPSPELKITVEKGDAGSSTGASVYSPKNEVGSQENDIRYIKTGDLLLESTHTELFGSARHYFMLILPVLLFFIFLFSRSIYLKSQSNVIAVNERKAARLARKQLKQAEKLKSQHNRDAFYAEVLTALNKYASYKMNIPVADLSRETIYNHLVEKNVNPDTIQQFMQTLSDCEYARYAPAAVEQDLNLVYNNTVALITKIEDESK